MITESRCAICAISEISVGFWTTRRCQPPPLFQKLTQITQARYARSQISQMSSVCRNCDRIGRAVVFFGSSGNSGDDPEATQAQRSGSLVHPYRETAKTRRDRKWLSAL